MRDIKEHVVRVRVDEETKNSLDQLSKDTGKSTSEIIRDGIESQKSIPQPKQNYIQYALRGFKNLILKDNKSYDINHSLIQSIYISDDITSMIVTLKENIHYFEHNKEIERFLNHVCFNLIANTETEVFQPVRILESVHDENQISCYDHVELRDSLRIIRNYNADYIYKSVIDTPTSIDRHYLKYERIFRILHNPNLIMQYMSLYQFLLDLLSEGHTYPAQSYVTEYFKNNIDKYPYVSFKQTRRKNKEFNEDIFTYIRNEIGHSEETDDLELYENMGKQINNQLIKNLVHVLNDVINQLDTK